MEHAITITRSEDASRGRYEARVAGHEGVGELTYARKAGKELIADPKVGVSQIATLIAESAGELSAEQRNFVAVLARNERLGVLPEIAEQYEAQRNAHEGVVDARIATAFPLSDAQLEDIVATLRAKYGREVKASVNVDPELLGGVSIRVGDEVMDASVRGKLAQLAGVLKA